MSPNVSFDPLETTGMDQFTGTREMSAQHAFDIARLEAWLGTIQAKRHPAAH